MTKFSTILKEAADVGKIPNLWCGVNRIEYDFDSSAGTLFMPPNHCCHMRGAIEFFQKIDPAVRRITTIQGSTNDTAYVLVDKKWRAFDASGTA